MIFVLSYFLRLVFIRFPKQFGSSRLRKGGSAQKTAQRERPASASFPLGARRLRYARERRLGRRRRRRRRAPQPLREMGEGTCFAVDAAFSPARARRRAVTPRPASPPVKPKSVSRIDAFVPLESPRAPRSLTRRIFEPPPTFTPPGTLREDRQGQAGEDQALRGRQEPPPFQAHGGEREEAPARGGPPRGD
jgi:hypothetical protein